MILVKQAGRCFPFLFFLCFPFRTEGTDWGGTGLIRIPNGRVIKDTELRLTLSQNYPYRHVAVTFGFLPFLELNGRIVTLLDQKMQGAGWEGYGYDKDKVADFKVLLLNEKKYIPSISFGVQDFHGTQLFFNEYVAISKQFKNFDFTIGYGGNLFGSIFNEHKQKVRELDGIFGGVEWQISPRLSFQAEYDPTEKLARESKVQVKSHLNFGFNWRPWSWLNVGYSFQRGSEHGFSLAITWPFGKPLVAQRYEEPFFGPVDHTPLSSCLLETGITSRLETIRQFLQEEGFSDVKVTISEDLRRLYVEYENTRYLSQIKGLGRVLRVVVCQVPSDVERVHVVIKSSGIPMVEVSVCPDDFINFLNGKISSEEMMNRTEIKSRVSQYGEASGYGDITVGKDAHPFSKKFDPLGVETYLNDPSGFWKARVGPTGWFKKEFGKGWSAETYVRLPVYSNVSTRLSPISAHPIRSDIVDYLSDTGPVIENLFVNKFARLGEEDFCRLTGGYLELQFAGFSWEYLKTFAGGRFGIGSEVTLARKRDADSFLGWKDFQSTTVFLKGYLFIPEFDLTLQVDAGRFLAGDKGCRLQVTRHIRGGSVFLWYTKTGTENFTGPNRNYADKGVGFALPVNIFQERETRGTYNYALSPWSRDVGQEIYQPYSLYDFIREFNPVYLKSHWNEISD